MENKTFYRVEHIETLRGMFGLGKGRSELTFTKQTVYAIEELEKLCSRHRDLPSIDDDYVIKEKFITDGSIGYDESDWRFAFKSLEDFSKFVREDEISTLKVYNFRIYKIVSNNYVESQHQAVFNIKNVIEKKDITEDLILKRMN